MTTWIMQIACWVSKATNTHSEYVIPIVIPLQQWMHKRSSMLQKIQRVQTDDGEQQWGQESFGLERLLRL
jgi:hypothetical protein